MILETKMIKNKSIKVWPLAKAKYFRYKSLSKRVLVYSGRLASTFPSREYITQLTSENLKY